MHDVANHRAGAIGEPPEQRLTDYEYCLMGRGATCWGAGNWELGDRGLRSQPKREQR